MAGFENMTLAVVVTRSNHYAAGGVHKTEKWVEMQILEKTSNFSNSQKSFVFQSLKKTPNPK